MVNLIHLEDVQARIFKIRGQPVMLDRDLARLYGVNARALRQQVKRNMERFPSDFAFALTKAETALLVSQFVTPSVRAFGGHLPYVFTEEGVAMLSGVIRSSLAVKVNIAIMRAFVRLRHAVTSNREVARRVEKLEGKVDMHETDIRLILNDLQQLKRKKTIPEDPIPPTII